MVTVDPINFQVNRMIIQELSFVKGVEFALIWAVWSNGSFEHNINFIVAKIYIKLPRCDQHDTAQSCQCNSMLVDATLAVANAFAMAWHKVVEKKSIKLILSQESQAPPQ